MWTPDGERTWKVKGAHSNTVSCLAASPLALDRRSNKMIESTTLLTGGFDGNLILWDISLCRKKREPPVKRHPYYGAHDSEVVCVVYNDWNKTWISGSNDGCIKVWSIGLTEKLGELKGHSKGTAITCLAIDGNFIFSAGEDLQIRIWNALNFTLVKTLTGGHSFDITCLFLVPISGQLVSCGRDGK